MQLTLVPQLQADTSGARYLGAPVSYELVEPYLHVFEEIVGRDRVTTLMQAKAERDGANEYHLTFVSPPEYEGWAGVSPSGTWVARVLGIGRQTDSESETYFVVLSSPEIDSFRKSLGLKQRDLHITLGYWPNDIYDRPKDASTLIWTPAVT